MLRAFIAVPIATNELRSLLADLGELGSAVKPVPADNLHLTLKFLGDTDEQQAPRIAEILRAAAEPLDAGELLLHGLGVFPHARRPTVVWVGLQLAEPLAELTSRLDSALVPLGFERQREPIHLHLTVARIRGKPPRELDTHLKQHAAADYGTAWTRTIELFQSELLPDKARYTSLASVRLRG